LAQRAHPRTGHGVEHPRRDDQHLTGRGLDVHEPTGDPLFAVHDPQASADERMPLIMNDDFLPDTGRMFGRLP
jgi:hypothetical protein